MNKDVIKLINKNNEQILNNLHTRFNISPININHQDCFEKKIISICPIGIEIEVKWRDYFPELFDKYLKNTNFKDLSDVEKENLTQECYILEDKLLPVLNKVTECGIEKGADKYWEFAFPPTSNINHTVEQIRILNKINAIPEGKHSLHLTIGGINNNRDTYYLLLLLEVLFCDKERLQSAFHKDNKQLSSTWARKGMG